MKINQIQKIKWLLCVLFPVCLLWTNPIVKAKDNAPSIDQLTGFSYELIYPENQVDKNLGYYKLKVAPNQKEQVTIRLTNTGTEPTKVEVGINSAKTNSNGVIEYGKSSIGKDPSMPYDYNQLVTAPKEIALNVGETKDLPIEIQAPDQEFDGIIAGAIQLMKAKADGEEKPSEGTAVINRYAYTIGIFLINKGTTPDPELKLNKVYPDQTNGRNTIFVNYSNIIPYFVNDMTTEVQISPKKSDEVLYETKKTAMRMAPYTFIDFPVNMNGESMEPGDYRAKILVTSSKGRWQWEKDFKISKEDADKFNQRDVGLVQEKGIDWKLILLAVGIFVLVLIVVFILIKVLRRKQTRKNKRSTKKSVKKNNR